MEKQRSVHNIRPETNYTMMIYRPILFDFQKNALRLYDN